MHGVQSFVKRESKSSLYRYDLETVEAVCQCLGVLDSIYESWKLEHETYPLGGSCIDLHIIIDNVECIFYG